MWKNAKFKNEKVKQEKHVATTLHASTTNSPVNRATVESAAKTSGCQHSIMRKWTFWPNNDVVYAFTHIYTATYTIYAFVYMSYVYM